MEIKLRLHDFSKFEPRCRLVLLVLLILLMLSGALLRRISGLRPGRQILYSTIFGKLFGDCSATIIIIIALHHFCRIILLILLISARF